MVPARQALARAFALADAANDEYEWRTAAHALYYALFHYAGEALESKTAGRDWRFYWNGTPSNGRPVRKNHGSLQTGWERYRNDYTDMQDGSEVLTLLRQAHQIRIVADYSFAADFNRAALDLLVITTQNLVAIIDGS